MINEKVNPPNEDQIKKFYDDNKNLFLSKEFRTAQTLLLDAKEYAKKLTVTEEEIKLLYEERKELLVEPAQRFLHQIIVDEKELIDSIKKKVNYKNFSKIASEDANLNEEDINLGWNTKNELPDEIVETVFQLKKGDVSKPIKSGFGWHIIKVIDSKSRNEIKYAEVKQKFQNEILLDKGKEAVFDLQDELEDLLASGSTFEEISKILDVQLITATKIDRNGLYANGKINKDFQDERILRTIFNQKLNEEGNIIDIDKDEGLAISLVNEIISPRQLSLEEARTEVIDQLTLNLSKKMLQKRRNLFK